MLWGFQVEEFQRKEVITQRVSKGGVKIWTQNKEGFIHQHKDSRKSCKFIKGEMFRTGKHCRQAG